MEKQCLSEADLAKLAAPLSGSEFLQASEERALAGRCGNPLCGNAFQWSRSASLRYKILHQTMDHQMDWRRAASAERSKDPKDSSSFSDDCLSGDGSGSDEEDHPDGSSQAADDPECSARSDSLQCQMDQSSLCCCSSLCIQLVHAYALKLGDPLNRLKGSAADKVLESLAKMPSHGPKISEDVAARGRDGAVTMLAEIREREGSPSAPLLTVTSGHLPMSVEGFIPSNARSFSSSTLVANEGLSRISSASPRVGQPRSILKKHATDQMSSDVRQHCSSTDGTASLNAEDRLSKSVSFNSTVRLYG